MEAVEGTFLVKSPDDLERAMTVVIAAMSRPPEERGSFVEQACAGDAALFAEVQRRVGWEERLGSFLLSSVSPRERVDRPFEVDELVAKRFRIRGLAGEGGMGAVYDAIDEKLIKRVALKCPKFEFRRHIPPEALSSLLVTHSNVCRVFEVHTAETHTGEVDFLTMEFLEGETLAARLSNASTGWLSTPDGRRIADQILAGLRAAHEQRVIHRDLKPGNVMLSRDTAGQLRAVLMDFGIAQAADIFSSHVRGTPAYVAPEIWQGQSATERSDIYALGVLFYEMATARKPFPEGTDWNHRLHAEPDMVGIPQPWRSIIARCLAPDPAQRFQSVAEIQVALRANRWRPWLLTGAAAAAVAALAAAPVKEHYWPSSPVRIAVLPPVFDGEEDKAVAYGFAHDLSYRLKTLRGSRRPKVVFALTESVAEQVHTPKEAAQIFGATHAIATAFRRTPRGFSVSAELIEAANGRMLRREQGEAPADGLPAQLFNLQSRLVDETARALSLRAESRIITIPAAAYQDYLQGMYYARVEYEKASLAIPYMKHVIKLAPDSALGYAGLAEAYLNSEYMSRDESVEAKAIDALAKAEQRDPESAQVLFLSGTLDARRGWFERAVVDFRRAIEREPGDSEPYVRLADTYAELNQIALAESTYRTAMSTEPTNYKPFLDAGFFFSQHGNPAEAERLYLEAVRLAPGQTRARLNLAALYSKQQRYAEQEAQTLAALAVRKTRDALVNMGDLREHDGRYDEAISYYEEAIRVGPRFYPTWSSLASALRKVGRDAEADRAYRDGLKDTEYDLKTNPRDAERLAWAAYYHAHLGEVDAARELANQALAMAPQNGSVRKRLILAYDAAGNVPEAIGLLEGASPVLRREISGRDDLSPALQQHHRFVQLVK